MRRPTALALALTLILGVVGLGAGVWWFGVRPVVVLDRLGERVVAGLESGVLPDADLVAPASEALTQTYAGMGELRPQITRGEWEQVEPGVMEADLAWSWVIHEGKPSWDYTTTLRVVRLEGEWKADVTPETVAPGLLEGERLRATRLAAERGAVVGSDGQPIAMNTPAWRLGIDKTLTDEATALDSAAKLADLVGLDAEAFVDRVRRSGPRAFIEARILRQHDPDDQETVRTASAWIGVRAIESTFPLGRTSTFLRPILGVVGEATAEQVEASGGTIRAGDLAGRGGLQEARNHVLAGTTGFVVSIVDADGTAREAFRVDAIDGSHVWMTIDVGLQNRAEELLADEESASALVAVRPSDGAILAAASGPGGDGLSTATLGQYAPGSTMKVVTALAMLRAGATPDTLVSCPDGYLVDGYRFDNWDGYPAGSLGEVPLREAFAWSCNATFLAQADALGIDALADAAASLGLTAEPNLVVGGFLGSVPTDGTPVEQAGAMIGQGKVLASPLGMATVAASVAAGHTVRPVLVDEPAREVEPVTPLTAEEAAALRDLMRAVVTDGTAGELSSVGSDGAKTGTASWGSAPVKYHGWVIVTHADLALAAF
ncbi:MAG: penicillin-binding transpeptidase domain-containing protein, partial [Propionibacteriaceae bacterium]|nr:penicillin-binding transpeptidase domain-containing protein [Propionibacteriaceae bacterium]